MTVPSEAIDAGQYATQYELLRAQVMGVGRDRAWEREPNPARGIGLALLLREGMPGWLKAVQAVLRASLAAPPAAAAGTAGVAPAVGSPGSGAALSKMLPCTRYHDITILLASLVLSTRHPAGLSASEGGYRPCP